MSRLRLSGGAIGGVVVGVSGFLVIVMVSMFLWYRRRYRRPEVLPQDVLRAEFASENDDGEATGSSTRLAPFLNCRVTRHPVAPTRVPPSLILAGCVSPVRVQARDGPPSASGFVVNNRDGGRSFPDAAEEKRRIAVAMREREDDRRDFGSGAFVSGNGDGVLPEYSHLETRSFTSGATTM